ncbi:MAG: PQQ-binding-like beta-propeller repeat protein [Pseudomonadota bacterium]
MLPKLIIIMILFLAGGPIPFVAAQAAETSKAEALQALYKEKCDICHADPNTKAPSQQAMQQMSLASVMFTLSQGKMRMHVEGMGRREVFALAQYVAGAAETYKPKAEHFCEQKDIDFSKIYVSQWGFDKQNSAAVGKGLSSIDAKNVSSLKLKWAFELPNVGNARSQPVVTEDTLFVAAVSGEVFALNRHSGCIKWHYKSPATIRTALTYAEVKSKDSATPTLFFGDQETFTNAIDAATGTLKWRTKTSVSEASMQTGAIIFHANKLIVPLSAMGVAFAQNPKFECCKSHGAVQRLDAQTGKVEWTAHMTPEAKPTVMSKVGTQQWGPSGAAVWSTPTIDAKRNLVYVGTGQNTSQPATTTSDAIIALDFDSGEMLWHYQATPGDAFNMACSSRPGRSGPNCPENAGPDVDFGASPILTQNSKGKDVLLAGQKSGVVHALDPENKGELLWKKRISTGSPLGGIHWGIAVTGDKVFAPSNDPSFLGDSKPGLYALNIDTGELAWEYRVERGCEMSRKEYRERATLYPECPFTFAFSAAVSIANDVIFAPALSGIVRAFDVNTGEVLWQFNTMQKFDAINGSKAHGGSMDHAGVQFAGNMAYMQSGYTLFQELPGNVLLAFELN